jgi:hypothetical protein
MKALLLVSIVMEIDSKHEKVELINKRDMGLMFDLLLSTWIVVGFDVFEKNMVMKHIKMSGKNNIINLHYIKGV